MKKIFYPLIALIAFSFTTISQAGDYPLGDYKKKEIEGFTILVNKRLLAHPAETEAALKEMASQLKKITKVLPQKTLKQLRKVRIFMEWEKKKRGAAEFHPSAAWLKNNGYNPAKVNSVEINNARNFVKWSKRIQPWMVLHELAHAYHFRVLGANHGGIKAAYSQAKERKIYESVAFITGGKRRHYALTNDKEYFAEISESWFGRNDFYPFNREDLRKHDPVGYRLMEQTWGKPGASQEKSVRPGINKLFQKPDLKKLIGIFEAESREIAIHREKIVAACKIRPGMIVADIGACTGLFTRLFAQKVGPKGKVYAVDIAPEMIRHIESSCKDKRLNNVVGVVCSQTSAKLPPNSIDLAFICDTYHHFEFPSRTMASIHKALRPGAQVVVIDFHRKKGKSREWIMNHVRAGEDVFTREIVSYGFKRTEARHNLLKENYFLRFVKAGK